MSAQNASRLLVVFLFMAVAVSSIPFVARATQAEADAMCNPVDMACPCNQKMGKKGCEPGVNWKDCPMYCTDVTSGGTTRGHCVAMNVCHGDTTSGAAGQKGGGLGMDQLMSAMKGLMDALKGAGGGGGGDSGTPPGTTPNAGCSTYYQTSIQGNPDPCSYYVPAANTNDFNFNPGLGGTTTLPGLPGMNCNTITQTNIPNDPNPCTFYVPTGSTATSTTEIGNGTGTIITNSGNGTACSSYTQTHILTNPPPCSFYIPAPISTTGATGTDAGTGNRSESTVSGSGNSNSTNNINVFVNAAGQGPTFFSSILNSISGMGGGGGDIDVRDNGSTIYAGNADSKTNSGIAGFFGSNATNGQTPGGIITRLCITRPWAGSVLSVLIPPTFFDTLCKLRGYQVGSTPPPPPVTPAQAAAQPNRYIPPQPTPPPPVTPSTTQGGAQTQVQTVPPQADIWAVPLTVAIGSRTSIFWNSKGVKSCLVSSPDGNFSETALSGGGSTVPIVATTVYTISCIAFDDSHVTNSVTVYLKI